MSKKPINAEGDTAKTIAPVTSLANDAEFCDSVGAYDRFGIKRSLLYELHAQGLIRGCSLRRRGLTRGKRLWSIDSIREFLNSQMERGAK
jgi:hypothetical protein